MLTMGMKGSRNWRGAFLTADTFPPSAFILHHYLASYALLHTDLINSWGKRPSASSVFGKYLTQQGLWVNNGYLLQLSCHPRLRAMVQLAVWEMYISQVDEKKLSTSTWR